MSRREGKKKKHVSQRLETEFARLYVLPVTRRQTVARRRRRRQVCGHQNMSDIGRVSYLFRSTIRGRIWRRITLNRLSHQLYQLADLRQQYVPPLTRTATGTLPSNMRFIANRKEEDTRKILHSVNKLKFPEENGCRQASCRSRSPLKVWKSMEPHGVLYRQESTPLSENEAKRLTQMSLRHKKTEKNYEIRCPFITKYMCKTEEKTAKAIHGRGYAVTDSSKHCPTSMSPQTSDFGKSQMACVKEVNFNKTLEFPGPTVQEMNTITTGNHNPDLKAEELVKEDTSTVLQPLLFHLPREKQKWQKEDHYSFGGIQPKIVVPDITETSHKILSSKSDCGTRLLETIKKFDEAGHDPAITNQRRIKSSDIASLNPGHVLSSVQRLTVRENYGTVASSGHLILQQTGLCEQELNSISDVKEESVMHADASSVFGANHGSGRGNPVTVTVDGKEQVVKDQEQSPESSNMLLPFFLIIGLPFF